MAWIKVKVKSTGRKYLIDDAGFDPRHHEKLGDVKSLQYRGSRVFEKEDRPIDGRDGTSPVSVKK